MKQKNIKKYRKIFNNKNSYNKWQHKQKQKKKKLRMHNPGFRVHESY